VDNLCYGLPINLKHGTKLSHRFVASYVELSDPPYLLLSQLGVAYSLTMGVVPQSQRYCMRHIFLMSYPLKVTDVVVGSDPINMVHLTAIWRETKKGDSNESVNGIVFVPMLVMETDTEVAHPIVVLTHWSRAAPFP